MEDAVGVGGLSGLRKILDLSNIHQQLVTHSTVQNCTTVLYLNMALKHITLVIAMLKQNLSMETKTTIIHEKAVCKKLQSLHRSETGNTDKLKN